MKETVGPYGGLNAVVYAAHLVTPPDAQHAVPRGTQFDSATASRLNGDPKLVRIKRARITLLNSPLSINRNSITAPTYTPVASTATP